MRTQFEYSTHPIYTATPPVWRVFVRTDDWESIQNLNTETEYKVCPALHMNLGTAGLPERAYIHSGYLSAFEFHDNSALKATNAYLAYKKVHFILIPQSVCDTIHLTGGTSGFEKYGDATYPRREDGSSWQVPVRDAFIPQIFNTDHMSVALKEGEYRSSCEVLIGGNWQDYAICFTVPKRIAREIASEEPQSIEALVARLKKSSSPYLVNGNYPVAYSQRVETGNEIKTLKAWWEKQGEERKLLCFSYAVLEEKAYREPNPYKEAPLLHALFSIHTRLNHMRLKTPSILDYLNTLQWVITRLHAQLLPFHPSYRQLLDNFVQEFKQALQSDSEMAITQRIQSLQLYNQVLQVEEQFWQRLKQSERQGFVPLREVGIHLARCRELDPAASYHFSEEELLEKLNYVAWVTNSLQKDLALFEDQKKIFQLLNLEQFRADKEQSFIFHLVEWHNVWVDKSANLFKSLSAEALHQQAIQCERTRTNLNHLQQLFIQCNHARDPGIHQKRFNGVFRQLVAKATNELEQAFKAGTSLDIGRYIDEVTHYLLLLLTQQLGSQRNCFFNEKMAWEQIQKLDKIPKPQVEELQATVMEASPSCD